MVHRFHTAAAVLQYYKVLGAIETTAIQTIFRRLKSVTRYLRQVQLFRGLRPNLNMPISTCDRYITCALSISRKPRLENSVFHVKTVNDSNWAYNAEYETKFKF